MGEGSIDFLSPKTHPRKHHFSSFFAMNKAIFKSYDIRALCPSEFHPEDAERIARVLVAIYKPVRVLVGRDMRETSPAIEAALIRGLRASGVSVTRIGLCSTPLFNFAMNEVSDRYQLGVMVTASHNPAEYNGLKLVGPDHLQIGMGGGMELVRDRSVGDELFVDVTLSGEEGDDVNVLDRYLDNVFSLVGSNSLPVAGTIVVDAGNGMQGYVMPMLKKRLAPLTVEPLYWELDGRFPHHEANPLKADTLDALKARVVETEALCGFAFDGDADRIGIVDEKGEQIPGDLMMALLAQELGRMHPAMTMLYDLRSSKTVAEVVEAQGGVAKMFRVGSAHLKKGLRENNALFAGELSMHFYFDAFHGCESGDYVLLLILQLLGRTQKPLSVLWQDLRRYGHSGEQNYTVQKPALFLEALRARFEASHLGTISDLDGVRIDQWSGATDDWWASIRSSNTEPLVRLNVETRDPAALSTKLLELEAMFKEIDPSIAKVHH